MKKRYLANINKNTKAKAKDKEKQIKGRELAKKK